MGHSLSGMIKALEALLKDVHKKDGGKAFVSLNDGARVRQAGRYWLYRFLVTQGTIPSNDTPVKVLVGDLGPVAGFVVSHRGGAVIVGLEKDHGPVIDAATLVVDLTWLLERLRNRLDDVRRGAVPFNRASAERVFHPRARRSRMRNRFRRSSRVPAP